MDIHAPERPIHTVRDFLLHIAIVTIGILIALGLEGLRESIRDHHLVRETRENFRHELDIDLHHADIELTATTKAEKELKAILEPLPDSAQKDPANVLTKLNNVQNPYYFFHADSWQAALSTGALAHMSTGDVDKFANVSEIITIYSRMQNETLATENQATTFFAAHPHPTREQAEEGTRLILLFHRNEVSLVYIGKQLRDQVQQGLTAASH